MALVAKAEFTSAKRLAQRFIATAQIIESINHKHQRTPMFSTFFINRPAFSAVIAIIIVIAGLLCMRSLPIEQYPKVTPTQVVVEANYSGASADTLSTSVASILENSINGVEGMIYIQSVATSSGRLNINVFFNNDVDADMAVVNVNNRVQAVLNRLPTEVQRLGVTVRKQSTAVVGLYHLYSSNPAHSQLFIANYAILNVIDEMKRILGVGDAQLWSLQEYAMRIWLDPSKLQSYALTPLEVISKIEQQNTQFAPGKFGAEPMRGSDFTYTITTKGLFTSKEEFENIIIHANEDGSTLRLKEVASIEVGAQDYLTDNYYNDIPSVPIRVSLLPGANMLEVSNQVDSLMERLSEKFPEGMHYAKPFRPTEFVDKSINEVAHTFVEAIILVVCVIYLFLGSFRATLIPVIAIPVSIIGTFAGLYLFGFSINLLTLFGLILAIGIVVDDAIIVIENVERIMHTEHLPPKAATIKSMREISGAVVAIVLVLSAVFLPVSFMGGFSGEIYKQFAITIVISVIISGCVALTLTPALCAIFLKRTESKPVFFIAKFNAFFDKLTLRFSLEVAKNLKRGSLMLTLFAGLIGISYGLFKATPTSLVPAEDMGIIHIHTVLPEAASLSRTIAAQEHVIEQLLPKPYIAEMTSISGYSFLAQGFKSSGGVGFHRLIDWDNRKAKGLSDREIIESLKDELDSYPYASFVITQAPTIIGLDSSGVNVYLQSKGGGSLSDLEKYTELIIQRAKESGIFSNVITSFAAKTPQYEVSLNREMASALNVNIDDVFRTMQVTFGSYYVNNFELYNRTFRVITQSSQSWRQNPEDLHHVFVKSNDGNLIPLSSLLELKRVIGAEIITRFNLFPAANIIGYPAFGYSSGEAIAKIEEIAAEILPPEYDIGYFGATYQEKVSSGAGATAFIFGLIFVFLILVAQYERWLMPLAVLTAVPFAVFGAILATFLRGIENDIYFQVGLLTLIALAAKNAILIIEFATHIHENEGKSITESAILAAKLRFRPIVMTSLAFSLGALPLAISSGAGSLSRHAIGTGVIGGMLAATFLAIFFIPLFFVYFARLSAFIKGKMAGVREEKMH